ncbi:MAG: tetratricopeptide repeat protein [Betaproteobacteria bacterium]
MTGNAPTPLASPSPQLLAAMTAHRGGRLADAEAGYRNVLAGNARDPVAWHFYSLLASQQGNHTAALGHIRRAIELEPAVPEFQVALGNLLKSAGLLQEAAQAYFLAVSMNPGYVDAYNNLGTTYRDMGTLPEAEAVLREAHRLAPDNADILCNLGAVCQDRGQAADAAAFLSEAARMRPDMMEAWYNLGNALHATGADEAAAAAYGRAVELAPDLVPGWYNLGNLLCRLDRLEAAGTCYQRVLTLDPGHVASIFNLGNVLQAGALHDEAIVCYREVLRHRPDHALAHFWWATALACAGRPGEATEHYDLALALDPRMARAYHMKGGMLYNQGRVGEAVRVSLKALEVQSDLPFTFSNSLFMMNYDPAVTPAELYARHREYETRFGARAPRGLQHANTREPGRPLKVGYLSPDLRRHSVSYFIEPVLAHHDRQHFEVHCYFNSSLPDDVTTRLKAHAHAWHDCYWMSDDELAARIAADGIDILVDLAGHTAGNRMLTLARKPAPLQVGWLGYPTTTGLAAIDYRITDPHVDPDGDEVVNVEQPLRMPHSYYCYRPMAGAPDPSPPPRLVSGQVTFASFNNFAKVSDRTLELWARVLVAVPGSRLLLKARSLEDAAVRRSVQGRLAALGIDPGRLLLLGWEKAFGGQLALYSQVDIGLDTFPYNGGTTTCEALWMGVPVITCRGDTHASRMGASLLSAANLPELIATTPDAFVTIARDLAADAERLTVLRASLRDRLRASALMDETGFTRDLEAAYRAAWRRWCAHDGAAAVPARIPRQTA